MAVLITLRPTIAPEGYDQVDAIVSRELPGQPGFISHAAQASGDGMVIHEVWESAEDQQRWFSEHIAPNLPEGMEPPAPEVTELHNAIGR